MVSRTRQTSVAKIINNGGKIQSLKCEAERCESTEKKREGGSGIMVRLTTHEVKLRAVILLPWGKGE